MFLSKYWSSLPYLGKIVDMWATVRGRMKVRINWLYHKDEVCGLLGNGSRVEDVDVDGAVFESSHFDDNNVQSISHKCSVTKITDKIANQHKHYDYCALGSFDPVTGHLIYYQDHQ